MLLLVLILVLIAFSLLVVALLSGSVLWAWVSVGVSVAAAVVLLIDYMQRRSAVKAGAEAGAVAAPSRAAPLEPEPPTEVLPVIPRTSGAGEAAESAEPGAQPEAATALFDQGADSQQTVVMPVVQPSASADRPSSASPEVSPSSGDSSPTVIAAGSGRSESASRPGEGTGGSDGAKDDQTTAVAQKPAGEQPPADGSADATAMVGTSAGADPTAAPETAADPTAAADSTPQSAEEPPEEPRDPAAAAVVAALETDVLVIDEQPRYHVTGCRALAGKQLIPIPAREAVELGFTPCGWCTPDRTLASQTASH